MVVAVRIPVPAVTGRVIALTGNILSLEKPFSGVGEHFSLLALIPILANASRNSIFAELSVN